MNLAIVCDDLIQCGGQERLVLDVLDAFPGATLYTTVVSKKWGQLLKAKKIKYKTSFMQKLPFVEQLNRYYAPLFFHTIAIESFDFAAFDKVLSVSSRFAHFAVTRPETRHICYMNSPGRMFWEPTGYFEKESRGLTPFRSLFLSPYLSFLRQIDFCAAQRVDTFLANSTNVKEKILKYYQRDATVLYPCIDYRAFENVQPAKGEYFLVITRLAAWKRVDIAIKACLEAGVPLKIIGEGPDGRRLKALVSESPSAGLVEFMGYTSDAEKLALLQKCKALVITQKEDFGITSLEAMACGKPVLAFGAGGVLETVLEGRTGEFFREQSPRALFPLLRSFDPTRYGPLACKMQAQKFDKPLFMRKLVSMVNLDN